MEFTEEQQMLREAARGALQRDAKIGMVREALDSGDRSRFAELERRQGWLGVGVSEEQGGEGGGQVELTILAEELGRAVSPGRFLSQSGLLVPVLLSAGADDALSQCLSDDSNVALVTAADALPAESRDVSVAGDGTVTGTAVSVLDALDADVLIVACDGRLWSVRRDDPGVAVTARPLADRSRHIADITFSDASATAIVTASPVDFEGLAPLASLLVAADALGGATRMLELTVEYVKDREQFGKPVGSFQAVKHTAADMLVNVEMGRSAVYHAASSLAAGLDAAPAHASAAKALATEAAAATADAALALHGAVGYTWEHDLHLYFKRAKLDVTLLGSPSLHRERVASALGLSQSQIATA